MKPEQSLPTTPFPIGLRPTRGTTGCVVFGTIAFAAANFQLPLLRARRPARAPQYRQVQMSSSSRADVRVGGGAGMICEPRRTATGAIIFMHGLGDTAAGWVDAFPLLDHVRAVLPTADSMRVTLNGGMRMPSWFDIFGLDAGAREDEEGIVAAVTRVNRIIDEQIAAGIPANRIVLAGFSQGGSVALTSALRSHHKVAGVVGLSSWLPLRRSYPSDMTPHAKDVPVLMCHGYDDMVVQYSFGEQSKNFLQGLGFNVSFKAYRGMGHSASDAEIADLTAFLESVLPVEK